MESGAGGERIGSGGQELTVSYDDVLYIVIRSAHRIYRGLTMRDYDDAYSCSLHKSCHFARHGRVTELLSIRLFSGTSMVSRPRIVSCILGLSDP